MTPTPPPEPGDPDPAVADDGPLDLDEAAVSAVLDDEATPEQRRRVARDPRLVARLSELRAVADRMAAPPAPLPAATMAKLRSAALAHAEAAEDEADVPPARDEQDGVEPTGATRDPAPRGGPPHPIDADGEGDDTPVTSLATHRGRRRRLPPLPAVAAAVVVLLAVGIGLVVSDGSSTEQRANSGASSAESDLSEEAGGGGAGAEAGDADRSAPPTPSAESGAFDDERSGETSGGAASEGAVVDADFADDDALRAALAEVDPTTLTLPSSVGAPPDQPGLADLDSRTTAGRAAEADVTRCSMVLEASDPDIGPAQAALRVTVDGSVLLVLGTSVAAGDGDGPKIRLYVVDPVSCFPRFVVQHDR